ncbi:MAG TPA: HEAT repeat domain-containing protein [Terriglobia bacterium]|nr:HEAT repeat domain-containing protein [Terriglobia bacterium]
MNYPHPSATTTSGSERRLSGAIILGVPIVLILVTFLFWYQTWFGRKLSDSEMNEYLQDTSIPHKTQHALTQVATEIIQHDPAAVRLYPQVVAMAGNKEAGLRSMAAWVMGQDNSCAEFHQALLKLVGDADPVVRSNAALALARFGDAAGDAQLRAMLLPYDLRSPFAGSLTFSVKTSDTVKSGTVVAHVTGSGPDPVEIRAPFSGVVLHLAPTHGATIAAGDEIAVISPDDQQLWEALRALYLVGGSDDLQTIEALARPAAGPSGRVREQAALTAEAIRKRASSSPEHANGDSKQPKTVSAKEKSP